MASEELKIAVIQDETFGRVVEIVDEYGVFAGYDVTDEQIALAAQSENLMGREANLLQLNTRRYCGALAHKGYWERRTERADDMDLMHDLRVGQDEVSEEGIADDMAQRTLRYEPAIMEMSRGTEVHHG